MNIVIVESETSDVLSRSGSSLAVDYGKELQKINPDLNYRVVEPYERAFASDDLDGVDGVVFPGAGVSWSANQPQGAIIAKAMEQVFSAGIPCFGSCNGLQLAAWLLGGELESGEPEVGIARNIELTPAGRAHPMMRGRADRFSAPTVHGDKVSVLPPGALHLAENAHTRVQAFAYEGGGVNFWGVEYHPELSPGKIARYIATYPEKFADYQNDVALLERAEYSADAAESLGTTVDDMSFTGRSTELRNWLAYVDDFSTGQSE